MQTRNLRITIIRSKPTPKTPDKPLETLKPLVKVDSPTINKDDHQPVAIEPDVNKTVDTWDIGKAVELRTKKDYTFAQLADHFQLPRSTIFKRFDKFRHLITGTELKLYRDNKADILDGVQMALVREMVDEDKLKGASVNNLAYAARQAFDMSRLTQGESTANILIRNIDPNMADHMSQFAQAYSQKIDSDALEAEYQETQSQADTDTIDG